MKPTVLLNGMSVVVAFVAAACTSEITSGELGAGQGGPAATSAFTRRSVSFGATNRNDLSAWLSSSWFNTRYQLAAPSVTMTPTVNDTTPTTEAPVAPSVEPPTAEAPTAAAPAPVVQPTDPGSSTGTAVTPPAPGTTSFPTIEPGSFPGGFIEPTTSTEVRARLSAAELQALLPAAGGKFTFPPPYNSEAIRLTDANNCAGGRDCVRYVGYSYWRNINNHVGQDSMLIVLGLATQSGGAGFSLFRYHKDTEKLDALGPVFAGTSIPIDMTGEDIYFSGTRPTVVYAAQGSQLLRVDVLTKAVEVVFDAASTYGSNVYLWQHHSSDDDLVHSAALRATDTGETLGCLAYREDNGSLQLFKPEGDFDECQVDRSGKWLVIKDNIDGKSGEDNRIIDLDSGAETDLMDEQGAAGHSDLGYGLLIAEDNWNNLGGAVRAWRLGQSSLVGPLVYHDSAWRTEGSSHISHTNARPGMALADEVVCQSTLSRGDYNRGSEIFCYRLDGSLDVMVVAPVMTNLDAAGGGDDYAKAPKGNLDVTGRYFIWTSNTGGNRLDAFLVKIPALLE